MRPAKRCMTASAASAPTVTARTGSGEPLRCAANAHNPNAAPYRSPHSANPHGTTALKGGYT